MLTFEEYLMTDHNNPNHSRRQNRAKSELTIKAYVADVDQFFKGHNDFNRKNVVSFRQSLNVLSPVSINRKMSSLKKYNDYLLEIGKIKDTIVCQSDYISIQKMGNPTNVDEETVLKFLSNVAKKKSVYRIRNIAIIYLLANSGIRRFEVCDIKLKDIDTTKGLLSITNGKGNKYRRIPISGMSILAVENWLKVRSKYKHADSEYLFISERGEKLNKEAINYIFDMYSEPECKVHPHMLRHNFCTTALETNKFSMVEVMEMAGHSRIETTRLYTHARMPKMQEKMKDFAIGNIDDLRI